MLCLSRVLPSAFVLVGTVAAQQVAPMQRTAAPAPIFAGTYYVATGQFVSAQTAAPTDGSLDVVYASNSYTGFYYDINDGTVITDEGRIPSLSSPTMAAPVSFPGLSNSYQIESIQLGYVTNSPSLGTATLRLWDQYSGCVDPTIGGMPLLDLNITGLPATLQPGGLTPFFFNVDMTGFEFCMQADGDGVYDDGFSDRFGWRLTMDTDAGFEIGPIVGSRPGVFAPTGDGTVFQNAGATGGSGLGTIDQWYDQDPVNGDDCTNWGGYDPIDNDPAFGSFWLVLGANLAENCASCANDIDDNFENNDICLDAAPLASPSMTTNLVVKKRAVDPDFYNIVIPANTALTADVLFTHADSDIDIRLYDDTCSQIGISQSSTDDESLSFFNCGTTAIEVNLEVYVWDFAPTDCGDYTIVLTEDTSCAIDDLLEDNDTCADATTISEGMTPNLRISQCDEDYYSIVLKNGESLDVTINFDDTLLDLDLYLYLEGVSCGVTPLATSLSVIGTENIMWVNQTGQTQTYIVRVDYFPASFAEPCGSYDAEYNRNGGTPLGSKFCFAEINSTGNGAHIFGTGSDEVLDNAFVLNAQSLPPGQFGFFLNSQSMVFVPNPAGSNGNLCIAGPSIGRFDANVMMASPAGLVSLPVDLMMFPTPMVFISITPGSTWNFQFWYRDIVGGGSNFTDALSVTFQ